MLHYDKLVLSEGIYKNYNSRKCMVRRYCFFNHGIKLQDCVCNGCHGLLMVCVNIDDIIIMTVQNVDYCCIMHYN